MIDAEVRYLQDSTESEEKLNKKITQIFAHEYYENATHQAGHVYHSLFWRNCNEIIVKQAGDTSLSGWTGLVIPYVQKREQFFVHIATKKSHYQPYCQEKYY